ncbi:hypothetical protein DSO57_1010933 [Entomophthora muscae]|uniref:Uncharacterized protein n=1 Tax=Entomophthora muscae TaxID=34485 RepID=A0ACC2SV88_9FUNG|nr:hypothetical protein DSO57_1010933 [Entomophthora muscae]
MWGDKGEKGGFQGGSGSLGCSKSSTVSSWMWGRNTDGDGVSSRSAHFMGGGVSLQPGEGPWEQTWSLQIKVNGKLGPSGSTMYSSHHQTLRFAVMVNGVKLTDEVRVGALLADRAGRGAVLGDVSYLRAIIATGVIRAVTISLEGTGDWGWAGVLAPAP